MKKYEILYDWPISEIARISDSEEAERFSEQLDEPNTDKFITLTEKIRILGGELAPAKASRVYFKKWHELRQLVKEFSEAYENFPAPSLEKLKISLLLAEKSYKSSASDTLDENVSLGIEEIDSELFELRELSPSIDLSWFCSENGSSLEDSVVIFSCNGYEDLESALADEVVNPELLFHLIATINSSTEFPSSQAVMVKKTVPEIDAAAINSVSRLLVLSTGGAVHKAHTYKNNPSIIAPEEIRPGEAYQQWNDVLDVISEYNSHSEILMKFLTIYHVIENFMFKKPIVQLEREKNGEMFSIRDFKRLYEGVDTKEFDALKETFKLVFKLNAMPSTTFQKHLERRWGTFARQHSKINEVLITLGLQPHTAFVNDGACSYFSKLVYAMRNSIVHNKETEFHVTSATLDKYPSLLRLLSDFLLPSLEEISFALISKRNSSFWYKNQDIKLFK